VAVPPEVFDGYKERATNKSPLSMCHSCDMDTPVQDDTGREGLDLIGTLRDDATRSHFGKSANEKAR
jgi:hypothetical protein